MKEQLRVINTSPLIIILLLLLLSSSSVKAKCHSIVYGCWRVKETLVYIRGKPAMAGEQLENGEIRFVH